MPRATSSPRSINGTVARPGAGARRGARVAAARAAALADANRHRFGRSRPSFTPPEFLAGLFSVLVVGSGPRDGRKMPQRAFVGNSYSGCDDASFPAPAARRPPATAEQLTVVLLSHDPANNITLAKIVCR